MNKVAPLLIFIILLFASSALAETTIKAEVDKKKLAADEPLTYKITLASGEKELPFPELPDFKGFQVISQSQSTSMSFAKQENKSIMEFIFVLLPAAAGKFTIGPSSVKINSQIISTGSFEIEVTQAKASFQPQGVLPESKEPQITL